MTPELATTIVTGVVSLFTAWLAFLAKNHAKKGEGHAKRGAEDAKKANDAVNNKHPDHPKLFDLVLENHDMARELQAWKKSYDDSPWRSGDGVEKWLEKHTEAHDRIEAKLDHIEEKITVCDECPNGHE